MKCQYYLCLELLISISHLQKAYPLRLKHTHIMFPPSFIDVAKNILKPFLSKKMSTRVSVILILYIGFVWYLFSILLCFYVVVIFPQESRISLGTHTQRCTSRRIWRIWWKFGYYQR